MPGSLLVAGAQVTCPHGGQVMVISSDARVTATGLPVALMTDQYLVAGCTFAPGGVPQVCVKVQWLVPAARLVINGQPPINQASVGVCLAATGAPNGPPIIVSTQPRVVAT